MMQTFRFKVLIKDGEGKERWADADKVFAHLMERYTKKVPNGEKPKPYKEKIEYFFNTMDLEWLDALRKAYPNVDIEVELNKSKMWLLSNSPKRNLKKFVNNWLAKAMGNKQHKQTEAAPRVPKYIPTKIVEEDVATPEEIREMLNIGRKR